MVDLSVVWKTSYPDEVGLKFTEPNEG